MADEQNFFERYRSRYSQYWVNRIGLIPNLPMTFDNSNDIYELMAWLQRATKTLMDDFLNLELEFEQFKTLLTELVVDLIPDLIESYDLDSMVDTILTGWLNDGSLVSKIRDIINEEVVDSRTDKRGNVYTSLKNRLIVLDKELEKRYFNVENFGCVGDGVTLNTTQLNNVFNSGFKNFYVPLGEYLVDGEIKIPSDINVVFAHGTTIKLKPTNLGSYKIFNIQGVKDINLINLTIVGDKETHTGIDGEWGHGLNISNSENILLHNLTVKDCWGDNVYIGGSGYDSRSRNIRFTGLTKLLNGRRQGMSVINVDGLDIDDLLIDTVNGTAPSAGLNFEPNNENETLSNIRIKRVRTRNCDNFGIIFPIRLMSSSNPLIDSHVDIKIDEFISENDRGGTNFAISRKLLGDIRGTIEFGKVTVENAREQAVKTYNWSEKTPRILIDTLKTTNHNRSGADKTTRESSAILCYSDITGYSAVKLQINSLNVRVDDTNSRGAYFSSPSGVDVNLGNYYYASPSTSNMDSLKPEEILFVNGSGNTVVNYAKRYYVLIENISNPLTMFGMDILTKIGTSIRLPHSQNHHGAKLKFQVIKNSEGANSYPNIRIATGDKISGGGIGEVTGSSSVIRLTGVGAMLELESMLGGWRVTNLTGVLTVS